MSAIISKATLADFIAEAQETSLKCWVGTRVQPEAGEYNYVRLFVQVSAFTLVAPGQLVPMVYREQLESFFAGMKSAREVQDVLDAASARLREQLLDEGMLVYSGLLEEKPITSVLR